MNNFNEGAPSQDDVIITFMAEAMAEENSRPVNAQDYEKAEEALGQMRAEAPEVAEGVKQFALDVNEYKRVLGSIDQSLATLYNTIAEDLGESLKPKLYEEYDIIQEARGAGDSQSHTIKNDTNTVIDKFTEVLGNQIKNNKDIQTAFEGKEDVLQHLIDLNKSILKLSVILYFYYK